MPEGRLSKAPLIAIVEDDEFFRESVKRLVRSLGYTVEGFPSAADFLASRRLDEIACLIADIHMPGMTGVELYACLIEAGQEIPTILVTAYPDEATRARALNASRGSPGTSSTASSRRAATAKVFLGGAFVVFGAEPPGSRPVRY
jgi:CheY-like chemotaxis protein